MHFFLILVPWVIHPYKPKISLFKLLSQNKFKNSRKGKSLNLCLTTWKMYIPHPTIGNLSIALSVKPELKWNVIIVVLSSIVFSDFARKSALSYGGKGFCGCYINQAGLFLFAVIFWLSPWRFPYTGLWVWSLSLRIGHEITHNMLIPRLLIQLGQ